MHNYIQCTAPAHAHICLSFLNDTVVQIDTVSACIYMCGHFCEQWAYNSAHVCTTHVFLSRVKMDGDVMVQWTITPPSPSSLFPPSMQPSIHSSFLSSLPLQRLHLCKRYCRAQTLKAKWSEVDLHFGLCYERTFNSNTAHLELMELVTKIRGRIYVEWEDCHVFTAFYFHHQASDQRYLFWW